MRLSRYPYELTEQDEQSRRGDKAVSSLRPLATDLGPPRPPGPRRRWPLFFVGLVCGAVSAISVTAWGARTHRWQLGDPEVRASAGAGPIERCPSTVQQPLVCPPIPAANASEASASPAVDAKCAVEEVAKGKKTKKKRHSVRSGATVPAQSAEPAGPPPEEQAESELSNWLK